MHLISTKLYTVVLCCVAAPLSLLARDKSKEQMQQIGIRKPLVFVENKGQVTNQYNTSRKDIQYQLNGSGVSVFVGNGQLHYQFNKIDYTENTKPNEHAKLVSARTYRMDVSLIGANTHARVIAADKQEYHESYRTTQTSGNTVHAYSYGKITYKDIYPNIDWVLYTKGGQLEYDFVVRPGGNPKDIQLQYEGATRLELEQAGLVATSPLGKIIEEKPFVYEEKTGKTIASNFVLNNNILSFNTAGSTGTMIIDPKISWASYYGGNGADQSFSAVADASGNVYSVGATSSISSMVTIGARDTVFGGTQDCFIAKYNSSGTLVWASYIGAISAEAAEHVAYDGTYLYIVGYTSSVTGSGFATENAYDTTYDGGTGSGGLGDAFILKYTTTDSLLWCTYYGGTGSDVANSVVCDRNGYIYICGSTASRGPLASEDGYDTSYNGGGDIFIAKFTTGGDRVWGTYYGGTSSDNAYDIALDKAGNLYITGNALSTGLATAGAFQSTFTTSFGQPAGILTKFTTNGAPIWTTYYGNGSTNGYAVGIDTANKVYMVGYTNSTTSISSPNAWQTAYGGGTMASDFFITKFDSAGARLWGTYYGGTGTEVNNGGLAFDAWNNLIITGQSSTTSTAIMVGIDSPLVAQKDNQRGRDIIVTKFTPQGELIWGTFWGGQRNDVGRAVVYNASNDGIYVTGYTNSADSFTTDNGFDTTYGTSGTGSNDAIIMKLNADTFVYITQPYTDTLLCPGSTWNVNYITTHPFNTGNTFTVLLSSATGSFASPTTIGSVSATTSGSIACSIPVGATAGTGYRIKILASDPMVYSPTNFYNIHIVPTVATNPSITSNSPTCVGDSIILSASTSAPATNTFTWKGPGGYTASTQNILRTPVTTAMAGTYKVIVSHSGCPSDSVQTTVVVNTTFPNQPVDSTNAPICEGTTLYLFTRTTTPGVTYMWTGPGGFTSTVQNPVIFAPSSSATGIYHTTINLNGCKMKDSIYAEVDIPSTPNITVFASPDTICAGDNASFGSSILFGGSTPQYQWVLGNTPQIGAISSVWGSPYLNDGDVIYCILTSSAYCVNPIVDTSNKVIIHILPVGPPTAVVTVSPKNASFTPGMTLTFKATIINGGTSPTYQWRVNGVNVPGATNNIYITNSLNYMDKVTVLVHSNAMCTSPDSALGNIISVSVGQITSSSNVGLYPNPNTGNFNIAGNLSNMDDKDVTIEVLNLMGQIIYTDRASAQNGMIQQRVDLGNNVPNGMYMLRLRTEHEIQTQQFTIRR